MRRRICVSIAAIITFASMASVPESVFGQGNTWPGLSLAHMVEGARWRLDSLRINAALNLFNTGYDTDIYFGYLAEPTPDFTLSASLPLQVLIPLSKKGVLELNDTPQYLFYGNTERERAWNNVFSGRFHLALDKVYFQAGGGISSIRQRLSPELDVNVREKADTIDGTFLWQTSAKVSLAVLYGYARYYYGQPALSGFDLAVNLNREESLADLVTYLAPSARARLFLDGQYGRYTFREAASQARDARSYGAYGGVVFVPTEGATGPTEPPRGSLSLGYKYFDIIDPAFRDGSGFVGAVNFSIGLLPKTTARAFFLRDFAYSVYSDGTFYLSTVYGAGVSQRLSRRTALSYDASFGRSDYPQLSGGGSQEGRNYRFSGHVLMMSIRMARYVSISFLAQFGRRNIGGDSTPRDRNFFGLNLTYGVSPVTISSPVRGLYR